MMHDARGEWPLNSLKDFDSNEIWIYGTGSFARRVYQELTTLNIKVQGFLDHFESKSFCDLPVFKLENLIISSEIVVVIGICNLHVDVAEIIGRLQSFQVMKIVNPVQFAILLNKENLEFTNYWLSGNMKIYENCATDIQNFRELLQDDDSRREYDSILNYRTKGDIDSLRAPRGLEKQYLAEDLGSPPARMRILELGSFQGEDISRFMQSGYKIDFGLLLEPDLENYKKLVGYVKSQDIRNVIALPLGAWNETTLLRFSTSGESGAHVSSTAKEFVPVIRIDDVISGLEFNYIKMDIEGAEIQALQGLEDYIRINSPQLAISVYHKPQDLWEIGLLLEDLYPGKYEYFLRTYGNQTFDSVLHAIPKGRL